MKTDSLIFVKRPNADAPLTQDLFEIKSSEAPEPKEGEVIVKTTHISLDPTHRIWIGDEDCYMPKMELGQPMRTIFAGVVEKSNAEGFSEGDLVSGFGGFSTYQTLDKSAINKVPGTDPTAGINLFGINGLTAYFGLLEVGKPKEGETVLVSGAAGAVGIVVCQIAKLKGCRVIGLAGSPEKLARLKELGVDVAINYKDADRKAQIAAAAPSGVDVYFDNVGGELTDEVLTLLAMNARIAFCGAISTYNSGLDHPMRNIRYLLWKRATYQGFIFTDYPTKIPEALQNLATWHKEGKVQVNDPTVVEGGPQDYAAAFNKLFDGSNKGKLCLKLTSA